MKNFSSCFAGRLRPRGWCGPGLVLMAAMLAGLLPGCGDEQKAATGTGQPVRTAVSGAPTATSGAAAGSWPQNGDVIKVPPAAGPAGAGAAPTVQVEIVSSDAQPTTVAHGAAVTYKILTRGDAVSATMQIQGLEMQEVPLTEKTVAGDLTTWTVTVPAPATPGNYRFYPTAVDTSGAKVTPPGVSAWSGYLTVT